MKMVAVESRSLSVRIAALVMMLVASGCGSEALPWAAQERAERRAELAEAQVRALQTAITMASARDRDPRPRVTLVRKGEVLWDIARRTNSTIADLATKNHLTAAELQDQLWVGRPLLVPERQDVTAQPTATAQR